MLAYAPQDATVLSKGSPLGEEVEVQPHQLQYSTYYKKSRSGWLITRSENQTSRERNAIIVPERDKNLKNKVI